MGKRKAPVIRSDDFSNPSDLSISELRAISIDAISDLPFLLQQVNWNKGAYSVFCLVLSPDNQRVLNGSVNLIGSLFKNKSYNAALFWPTSSPTNLTLSLKDLSIFQFPNGSLTSNYVPCSAFQHSFLQNGAPVAAADLTNLGITPFCLRAHLYPTTDTFMKMIISLTPSDEARLQSVYTFHDDPRFPAIKLGSFEFPMGPPCSSPILNRQWGFPIVPIIRPASNWLDSSALPSGADLRNALAAILSSAILPETKQNFATYDQRCEVLLAHGHSSLKSASPPILWPAPIAPPTAASQGWLCYFQPFISFLFEVSFSLRGFLNLPAFFIFYF